MEPTLREEGKLAPNERKLGPVYTTVEKASGLLRMLGKDMVI